MSTVNRETQPDNNINDQDVAGWTLLHHATKAFLPKVSKVLKCLSLGADCNIKDKEGYTPLHLVLTWISTKHIRQVIPEMVKYGGDCNVERGGRTPLQILASSKISLRSWRFYFKMEQM